APRRRFAAQAAHLLSVIIAPGVAVRRAGAFSGNAPIIPKLSFMRTPPNPSLPSAVAGAILLAGFAATVLVSWPGHLSYDSILQLLQGRTGIYNAWPPPVMAWLLGLGDALVPGTGLFVTFDVLLAFGAFAGILLLVPRQVGWAAVPAAVAVVLTPQVLIYQGVVWKDVLFADSAVAGFVCLA